MEGPYHSWRSVNDKDGRNESEVIKGIEMVKSSFAKIKKILVNKELIFRIRIRLLKCSA